MPTTIEFLRAVLPSSGVYCYTVIVNKQARNYFVSSLDALASGVLNSDGRLNGTDGAVYHACASYDGKGSRQQTNVSFIKSFWLDIDTGPNKPYLDVQSAIDHVSVFIGRNNLPIPTLVCSGTGLHVYWLLDRGIDRGTWQPYAQALKSACQQFGLGAGPERTADSASILRPPGTTHRKGAPLPVIGGPLTPPSPLEAFNGLLSSFGSINSTVRNSPLVRSGRRFSGSSLLADCARVTSPEPIDFDRLSNSCGQFREFRYNNNTYGPVPEPTFYALLGVLGWVYNGDAKAHEWASKHPNYDYNYTQRRLERVRELSGPTTCAHIKSLNPKGCEGCPFGQTTPLEAGRHAVSNASTSESYSSTSQPNSAETPPAESQVEGSAVAGHPEYQFKQGALFHCTQSLTGSPIEVKLASYPVRIASLHSAEINKDQYYYLIQHYMPHNGWHDVVVKPSLIRGPMMAATMANMGVEVHDPTRFQAYIRDSVDTLKGQRKAETMYEQFGWKGDRFLYGDMLYGVDGPTPAAISPELKFRSQWLRPTPGGSVDGWKHAVDNLMGRGSEGMSLTILASFASALMPFFDTSEGGAVINLMTRHSGAGKSTAIAGARTVWSSDPKALELVNIDTKVTKAKSLGVLCNLPCLYDEFDNKDPEVVREIIEMFTSGRDKMRGGNDGTTIVHSEATWRMIFIIASNSSIQDSIASLGRSEAPALRVLELPVESSGTLTAGELMRLAKQLNANAGWAGQAFISYLVQPGVKEWVIEKLEELVTEITEKGKFGKEHRFWVRALAAISCAGLIVEHLDLIEFSPERIVAWALDFYGEASGRIKSEAKPMVEHLSSFLNEMISETLTMPGPAEGRRLFPSIGDKPKQRVNIRIENKGETCYVSQKSLRTWLEKNAGGGYTALLQELRKEGVLREHDCLKVLTAGTEISGGQVRCISFDFNHPKFSGMLREVKEAARHDNNIRNLTR